MAIVKVDFIAKSLMRTVTINAIVPIDKLSFNGKLRADKPFKTLYLLHGIFGNYTDWLNGTRVQRWAEENNLVVIMPSGENKFYVDMPNGENYSEFIGKELVEVTRKLFPLSTKREDTYIAGLSMGGYGALINGLKYNQTFSYIAALSSGLIIDNVLKAGNDGMLFTHSKAYYESIFGDLNQLVGSDKDYRALIKKLVDSNKEIPTIYMACGTEDFLLEQNREYYQYLLDLGVDVEYKEAPGGHDWDFWDTSILDVIKWLPLETKEEGIHSGNVR